MNSVFLWRPFVFYVVYDEKLQLSNSHSEAVSPVVNLLYVFAVSPISFDRNKKMETGMTMEDVCMIFYSCSTQ